MNTIYKKFKNINFNDKIEKKNNVKDSELLNVYNIIKQSNFFSGKLQGQLKSFIENKKFYCYEIYIKDKDVQFNIVTSLSIREVKKLYLFLKCLVCFYIKNNISKKNFIYIVPLDIPKFLPNQKKVLTPENINSAFSYVNYHQQGGNIYIYRKQELIKVFVHELLHTFHQDHKLIFNDIYINEFNSINELNINESLNELCTIILTIYIKSFLDTGNLNSFIKKVEMLEKKEINHSLKNVKRIMLFNKLDNVDLFLTKKYKQNASIFSYIILRSALMYYMKYEKRNNICNWCINNNNNDNFIKVFRDLVLTAFKNENWKYSVYKKNIKDNFNRVQIFKMSIF